MSKSCLWAVTLILLFLGLATGGVAREIAGVELDESIKLEDGTELVLNGAAIRNKFFFDIYVAALYLEKPSTEASEVLAGEGPNRVAMHFLYEEVEKEKLVSAWEEGFKGNLSKDELAAMQERIDTFNSLFVNMKKGQSMFLDYRPKQGTAVIIEKSEVGLIMGKDFNNALLRIWLGDKPVTSKMKKQLLSGGAS